MPLNTWRKICSLDVTKSERETRIFNWTLGQTYQISKLLLKDSLKHSLFYIEKMVWLAFLVAFVKSCNQSLIFVMSLLYLRLKFMTIFSPFISWEHTRYFWGEWNDDRQVLEHIQCRIHSAHKHRFARMPSTLGYTKWHIYAPNARTLSS